MSRKYMSHVTHMNDSCHTHTWFISHTWTSHVTQTHDSCHTREWVMSHKYMSHVTHYMSDDSFIVWHDSFIMTVPPAVLQCVVVCCSMLQCVAAQFVAVCATDAVENSLSTWQSYMRYLCCWWTDDNNHEIFVLLINLMSHTWDFCRI